MASGMPRLTAKVGQKTAKGTTVTQQTVDRAAADYAGVLEIRENNTEQVAAALNSAIAKALTKIGQQAEGNAKLMCPTDTGRLKNSITNQIDMQENAVYIGTNVEYAPYVELGTRRQDPHPYLRPAASEHGEEYRAILKGCLESA